MMSREEGKIGEKAGVKVNRAESTWHVWGVEGIQGVGSEVFSTRFRRMAGDEAVQVGRNKIVKDLICCKKDYILKYVGSHRRFFLS